ncbi:hypothetical protein C7T94_14070 [Pedobacter yulinensis]|uniref:HTH araC/xylS-type domain-containing protein n=1 Tax=Pedobacter yulinensis TaxID=2126353 RepID=A0A2T3HMJ8_9SPHI|nr:AraC family transcriptional regulator [Pedobacter yulinensis]PST83656.1 hypothetical protein C7T94_14070 [Pedobacter yulinensis]
MTTLYRFPPKDVPASDATFIKGRAGVFAKLKVESKADKRLVFLTEHTLIFVISGQKLLHLPDQTFAAGPNQVVLLKKGIYVMAEYLENEPNFEAILLFLPAKILQTMAASFVFPNAAALDMPFISFQSNELINMCKRQLRQYFFQPLQEADALLETKQKEMLLLLMSAGYRTEVGQFIKAATSATAQDLDYVLTTYLLHPVSLAELASLTNRSLATFKRDFQRKYGCAPRKWMNRERLKQAGLLLNNTDRQIAEIATACGFENTSYFIRIFRNQYGMTPADFRADQGID